MKKIVVLFMVFAGLLHTAAKAQNLVYDANAEVRTVAAFTGVEANGGISVYISQGKEQAIAVSADDQKAVSKIRTEVKNGILHIDVEAGMWNKWNWGNKKIKAYITVTDLASLRLGGGSVGKLTDELTVTDFKLDLSGGSIITGKFKGASLKLDLSGGSIANVDGNFETAEVQASGGSIFKGYDTEVTSFRVDASGGSIINVTVSKELSAVASGGSIINYKGDGVVKSVDASGGSTIKKKD